MARGRDVGVIAHLPGKNQRRWISKHVRCGGEIFEIDAVWKHTYVSGQGSGSFCRATGIAARAQLLQGAAIRWRSCQHAIKLRHQPSFATLGSAQFQTSHPATLQAAAVKFCLSEKTRNT